MQHHLQYPALLLQLASGETAPCSISAAGEHRRERECCFCRNRRERECLLYDSRQGKMMIIIMKTPGSQVDSPVTEGKRREGGGREVRDLHKDT
jgi:hypothetical protein